MERDERLVHGISYVMLESAAFFEPYKHVLKQIQSSNFTEIPFQEYLVGVTTDDGKRILQREPKIPKYLEQRVGLYDLSCICLPEMEDRGRYSFILSDKWKNTDCFKPTGAQLKAVKTALSKDLTLIQAEFEKNKVFL